EEITYAHRAKLNVVVCSRALINIARGMERKYGIPFVEVSFFGKTEMSKALRSIKNRLNSSNGLDEKTEAIIEEEEKWLEEKLKAYGNLKGKKAVLYTGGVKSWSFISALMDLGIEIVAIGTKKSSLEDEEKMKEILGQDAPLVEDVTPKNLLRLLKDKNADILVAGGRNQYLAVKEGYPFVDVNQERHTAYAGYEGLINLAGQISSGIRFYAEHRSYMSNEAKGTVPDLRTQQGEVVESGLYPRIQEKAARKEIVINPLKHSQSIGAAIAFQGIDKALPIIHGAQGCTFLGKVLLTKHFREPSALASTKLFTENVVMGSEDNLVKTVETVIEKNNPDLIGILTSGLSEVKGDDIAASIKHLNASNDATKVLYVPTSDYEGGLETGYAKAVEAIIGIVHKVSIKPGADQINVLAGSHLTPADFTELREIIESFGLKPIILPDLSALDGSRQGISALSFGGTKIDEIKEMSKSEFTFAIGSSMEASAKRLNERFGVGYRVFESITGLRDTDIFMETLSMLSGRPISEKHARQRRILIDGMRDAHFYYGNKKVCLALEDDLSLQTASWLDEMGVEIEIVDINLGDLFSMEGDFDLLISNSHAEDTAKRLGAPLYQMGFPVYKVLGNNHRITIGYRGTLGLINDIANLIMGSH
ncbi:MAG: nitrogenase iron-molybdenum cofactor biosynthesis protein NifN, partial [Nitrospirae bacterium]|nr:nitrogenase iron-molybdenum cofactor biosynthesis protein NifN [Nitrospirota bacterium]